ncbi:MAG: M67 family metallopeptidase [Clostridia bacterium]|nr:M67 family metallopeptidase [Clostridia bacterium]
MSNRSLEIPREMFDAMVRHAQEHKPLEACGLVGGREGRAERFFPTPNAAASPVYYTVPPQDILRVMRQLDRDGLDLVAIFHSHPASRAYPSETDIRNAHYPDAVYLILSLAAEAPDLRGYRIVEGTVEPVEVRVV